MPRYGFSGQPADMKIFILFVMRHVSEPVMLEEMAEMVLIDDNMNYFQFSQSVSELAESGLLQKEPGSGGGDVYTLSPYGFDTLEPMERSLPASLRSAGREKARESQRRLRMQRRVRTEILSRDDDIVTRLTFTDGRDSLLQIELVSGTREKAERMSENFKNDAEKVFDGVVRLLLDDDI